MDPALYIAAKAGNIDVLLQNNEKIGVEVTPNKNTVLHIVSQLGKTECVQKILSVHPSLLRRVNSSGESALHLAAKNGQYDVVLQLVSCAASLDASDVESGVGAVKELLRLTNKEGDTALHEAVRYNRFNVVEFLTKADPEYSYAANNDGETPLSVAAKGGFHELVEVILKTCKSPTYGGPGGTTALHWAVISKNKVVTRKLVDWDKSLVKKTDEKGQTPLHYAALLVWTEEQIIASQLLKADNSVAYVVDNNNNTALHLAAMTGNKLLIEKVKLHAPDCWEILNGKRQSILHIALEHGKQKTAEYIVKNDRGINTLVTLKDVDGNTPLHLMAASNCIVRGIIHHHMVAKNALNRRNLTPLDMVPGDGSDVKRALIQAGARWGWQKETSRTEEEKNKERTIQERDWAAEEKEMIAVFRKSADTNMVVAALIVTIAFTAGFTMPGGYNGSGTTVLSRKPAFQAFMISDAIALLLSCIVIFLNSWGTFYSDYATIRSFDIATSFMVNIAIGAMMIAFSTATYAVLPQSSALAIATCLIGVLSIPVSIVLGFKFASC